MLLKLNKTIEKLTMEKNNIELKDNLYIECEECDMEYLKEEWKVTIQTQMHFNDLIMRYRSIILSVFITSLGVIYGISEKLKIESKEFGIYLMLASIFWICCFFLDFFYYNKLLLGAVEHAKKFDNNSYFKNKGLFGLTDRIASKAPASISNFLIISFYSIPAIAVIIISIIH